MIIADYVLCITKNRLSIFLILLPIPVDWIRIATILKAFCWQCHWTSKNILNFLFASSFVTASLCSLLCCFAELNHCEKWSSFLESRFSSSVTSVITVQKDHSEAQIIRFGVKTLRFKVWLILWTWLVILLSGRHRERVVLIFHEKGLWF